MLLNTLITVNISFGSFAFRLKVTGVFVLPECRTVITRVLVLPTVTDSECALSSVKGIYYK